MENDNIKKDCERKAIPTWMNEERSTPEGFAKHIFDWGCQSFSLKVELYRAERDKAIKQMKDFLVYSEHLIVQKRVEELEEEIEIQDEQRSKLVDAHLAEENKMQKQIDELKEELVSCKSLLNKDQLNLVAYCTTLTHEIERFKNEVDELKKDLLITKQLAEQRGHSLNSASEQLKLIDGYKNTKEHL